MDLLFILSGVALLYLGGEALVRGAAAIGRRFGLSPAVIGLTIVALGTSSPELAASVAGVLRGSPAIAFGNVVGSNIANLGLVLGVTALLWPMAATRRFLHREMPLMLSTCLLMYLLVLDGRVGRVEGLLLLVLLALYLRHLLRGEGDPAPEPEPVGHPSEPRPPSPRVSAAVVGAGIGALVLGAHLLIKGAVGLSLALGVSERVVGLTVVAFGTSLPEMASCLVAAWRRHADIALGNLIGSNVFNILFILGSTAGVHPVAVERSAAWLDLSVMVGFGLAVWLFLATGARLVRSEGAALGLGYGLYVWLLFA